MGKQLPKGWVEALMHESVEMIKTGVSEYLGSKKYFSTGSIKEKTYNEEGSYNYGDRPSRANRIAGLNDVMQARMAETDKAIIVDENFEKTLFSTGFFQLRCYKDTIVPKFIYHYLKSDKFNSIKNELSSGSTQIAINDQNLKKITIPLPPRAEQDRIVAKVDALMAQHAGIQQAMERIPQLLKDFRQQVLTQAVTGKLTEEWRVGKELDESESFINEVLKRRKAENPKFKIPDNVNSEDFPFDQPETWSFAFLQTFGEFTRGKSKHRPRNDERLFGDKYPFIQTGAVSKADLITKADKYLSEFGLKQSRLFPKGTLCITIAANIAETAILDIDCCFPDSVVGYLPFEDLYSAKFAMFYLRTIQKELEQYAPATAQKNINLGILFNVPFPVPPLQEQQEIVHRVERLFEKATAIEQRYEQLKSQIDTLPQAILHKAFKGELVEQLDSDGSAVELLREIEEMKLDSKKK